MQERKYYTKDSKETIIIITDSGDRRERPIARAGMKIHKPWQLKKLLSKKIWNIDELKELEGW